ncbi:MAG TPA: FAD-dependent oxidoreductase, partial [Ktedonobacterales bacterium]|nr:FAD-dependent oxidoreductase [Ktedonobacterales bacterium]
MPQLVIIGGSDAGISAALRACELDPSVAVTVVVADAFPNYSICGLPFYLSGETPDWHMLAHRTADEITAQGITLLLNHTARRIEPTQRQVVVEDEHGQGQALSYDRLIVATGAEPHRPAIAGLDLPGVYLLHTMADSFAVHAHLDALEEQRATSGRLTTRRPRAAIVGGGYIGLELADAFRHRGLDVTLVQRGPSLLNTVEPEIGDRIANELRRHGVEVVLGATVGSIVSTRSDDEGDPYTAPFFVEGAQEDGGWVSVAADIVVAPTGVRPVTQLAQEAGCALG